MAGPTEFSLEAVRQYMLARDGQVTNHELVKYFRAWLTSPTEKESARQRFKEYVNTLATIRQENGEKYLVLKRKYYPHFDDDSPTMANPPAISNLRASDQNSGFNSSTASNSPSLLDEVMASYTPISKQQSKRQLPPTPTNQLPNYGHMTSRESPSNYSYQNSPSGSQRSSYASSVPHMQNVPPHMQHRGGGPPMSNTNHMYPGENQSQMQSVQRQPPPLPPYRPPPNTHYSSGPPPQQRQEVGLPMPSDYGLPTPRQGVFHPPSNAYMQPQSNMTTNPFEAVGLPSLTGYNSANPNNAQGMPPLPTRNRDPGMNQFSRSSSAMSLQGSAGYPPNLQQQYQRQQSHNSGLTQSQFQPHPTQHQMYSREGSVGLPSTPMYPNPAQNAIQQQQQFAPPPPLPSRNVGPPIGPYIKNPSLSQYGSQSSIATRSSQGEPVSRKSSSETENFKMRGMEPPISNQADHGRNIDRRNSEIDNVSERTQRSSSVVTNEDTNASESPIQSPENQSDDQRPDLEQQISVKERTKTFNRMASKELLDNVDKVGRKTSSGESPDAIVNGNGSTSSSGFGNSSAFSANSSVKRRNSRAAGPMTSMPGDRQSRASSSARGDDNETSSISTLDQTSKQWMVKASQGDYHALAKMLKDDPRLAKHKDFVSGYTALHWAAKHGNLDMIKLLAGSYSVQVNLKSHGGYTPLHLACQFGHQEVFDILVKAYGADPHSRDNSGRKPRQYMVVQDQAMGLSLSNDTFRQLKDRRRHRRQAGKAPSSNRAGGGALSRFGSLSVKVKKTTEAFNNYFNSARNGDMFNENGGGFAPSSLPPIIDSGVDESGELRNGSERSGENDSARMPPPKFPSSAHSSIKKRKSKRSLDYGSGNFGSSSSSLGTARSAPVTPTSDRSSSKDGSLETVSKRSGRSSYASHNDGGGSEDSDSEYGFDGPQWGGTVRH